MEVVCRYRRPAAVAVAAVPIQQCREAATRNESRRCLFLQRDVPAFSEPDGSAEKDERLDPQFGVRGWISTHADVQVYMSYHNIPYSHNFLHIYVHVYIYVYIYIYIYS